MLCSEACANRLKAEETKEEEPEANASLHLLICGI